jgi:(p)ppGpp synthase/HD superfamily hydrolase
VSELSFLAGLPLASEAVEFARARHRGQRRLGDHAPYLLHPLEVAGMLHRSGYPDAVVAAGVLHDVLEDTDAERAELETRFGREVAALVAAVTDDPAIADDEERKHELTERVRRTGGYAAAVYAADKISKVRELRVRLALGDDRAVIEPLIARHRRSLAMLDETISGSRLVEILRFELEALDALPPG